MKIAYNPTTAAALTSAPSNNDIVFDLSGVAIYARGIKFDGKAYSVFKKHTSANSGGYNGLVPVPSYTISSTRFLREDGTWVVPTNTKYSVVTASSDGLVPKFDAADGTINNNSNDWVLTNNNGAIGWYKLPANAFLNNTYSSLSEFSQDSTHRLVTDTQIANWNAVYNIMTTDSDTVINKWQEVVDFLATYTEADTLSNLLNNKVNKDQIVTSTVAGLAPAIGTAVTSTIGSQANEWVLTSTKGAEPTWRKLPSKAFSNTTYSAGTGLSLNGTTFSNTGVLSVVAGSENGTISVNGADVSITGLGSAAYTNSSAYAAASHTHTKSQITDFPTSMPASDVYSWAKASSKPSYSWSEITSKPTTFTPASHSHNYAGSSSAGGAASSANKLNTNAGSSTKPVYFSGGVPVACNDTLGVNISGNAASVDGYSISVGSSAGSDANTIYFVI